MRDHEHLELPRNSDSSVHNDLHEAQTRAKALVSTLRSPGTISKISVASKTSSKVQIKDGNTQSHLPLQDNSSKGRIYSNKPTLGLDIEARALMLDPKNYSLANSSEVMNYVPFAPNTTTYKLSGELAQKHEFKPASVGLTSSVRKDAVINSHRKLFRRLGRDLYNLSTPRPEENRYPSQACEIWASHIFNLLDLVVTFQPTCLITDKLIPAQEIGFWPEYGDLHITYTQLIDQSLTQQSDRDLLRPIPKWPASDHLFHAEAFEVAAVSFRDQMERSIRKLYDLMTLRPTDLVPSKVISTGYHKDPMQEESSPNSLLPILGAPEATLSPLKRPPRVPIRSNSKAILLPLELSRHSSHQLNRSRQTPPFSQGLTAATKMDDYDHIQSIESPTLTTGSQPAEPCLMPPDSLDRLREALRRLESSNKQRTSASPTNAPKKLKDTLKSFKSTSGTFCIKSIDDHDAAAPVIISTKLNVGDMAQATTVAPETEALALRTSAQRNLLGKDSEIKRNTPGKLSNTQGAFNLSASTSNSALNPQILAKTIAPTAHTCASMPSTYPTAQCATLACTPSVKSTSLGTLVQGSTSPFIRSEDPLCLESFNNRPRTPSELQDHSSLVVSSLHNAFKSPIKPSPQESSKNPSLRTAESRYTPSPVVTTAPEAVDNQSYHDSPPMRTISSQTLCLSAASPIVATRGAIHDNLAPSRATKPIVDSQVPSLEVKLLKESNRVADVISCLDRPVETDTCVHTPVELQDKLRNSQYNQSISSLAVDARSQQQKEALGSMVIEQLHKPVAGLVAAPLPTLLPELVAQKCLCDVLPNTPKRRDVSPPSALSTGTREDNILTDESKDISIYSTVPVALDQLAEVNNRLRQTTPVSSCSQHDSSPPQDLRCVDPKQEQLAESMVSSNPNPLSPRALDEYLSIEEQESVRASLNSADTSASATHAATRITPVLVPELNDRTAESIDRSLPTSISPETLDSPHLDAPSSLMDVVVPNPSPTTRITRASMAELHSTEEQHLTHICVPTSSKDALDSTSSTTTHTTLTLVANEVPTTLVSSFASSPTSVSPEVPSSLHKYPSSSSTNALASTTSAATHTTRANEVESALKSLRTDNRPAPSLRTSSTSSRSLSIDSPLQINILTEPSPELLAQFTARSSITASSYNITAPNQSIERSNKILFDCQPLDEVSAEPASNLSAQRDNSLFTSSDCSIKALTPLFEQYNDIILDPLLRKESSTKSTPNLVNQPLIELFLVPNQVLSTPGGRIEPNNINENTTDFSLKSEFPADPTPDRFAQLSLEPNLVLNFSTPVLDELIEHNKNFIVDRTSISLTIAAEDPKSPHIFAPPDSADSTDSVNLVISAATRKAKVRIAESTPRRRVKYQRNRMRPTAQDLPSRADHPDRQTSFEAPRHSPGTVGPINPGVKPSLAGREEGQSRRTIPSVEPTRLLPSKHCHRRKALPFEEPNTSRHSLAPPRPHTAAYPIAPARHEAPTQSQNIHELPHLSNRSANLQQFNELFHNDAPTELARSRLKPIRVGLEGENDAPENISVKKQQIYRNQERNNPPAGPPNESGDDSDSESMAYTRTRPFELTPRCFNARFKLESIPEWNDDTRSLSERVLDADDIAKRALTIRSMNRILMERDKINALNAPFGDKYWSQESLKDRTTLEIDVNSDLEMDRSDSEAPEDRSDDIHKSDIESKINVHESKFDQECLVQRPTRNFRNLTAFVHAYTPINSDVTQLHSEGDIFDLNPVLTCKSARSPTKHLNLYIDKLHDAQTSDSNAQTPKIPQPLRSQQQIAASCNSDRAFISALTSGTLALTLRTGLKPEIDLIQACKPPLKGPEPPPLTRQSNLRLNKQCPIEPVNFPTSKYRNVVTGGDTKDTAELEGKLEKLLAHLGGLKNSNLLIKHDALPWMEISDILLHELLTRHSTFPNDPGIQALSDNIVARTRREFPVRLLRADHALSTVYNQPVSMMKVLGNPTEDDINIILIKLRHPTDLSKILSEYSCSNHSNPHTCTDQDLLAPLCELQPRTSIDSSTQPPLLVQQAASNNLAELLTVYAELATNGAIDNRGKLPPNNIHSESIHSHTLIYRARASPLCTLPLLLTANLQARTPQCMYQPEQEPTGAPTRITLEASAKRARNDYGMRFIDLTHSSDTPAHKCIDRTFTIPRRELRSLIKPDLQAQTLQRWNQLMRSAQNESAEDSEEFVSGAISIFQDCEHENNVKDKKFILSKSNNLVPDNLHTQQVLIESKVESNEFETHSVKEPSRSSLVTHSIRLGSSYITHPVAKPSYLKLLKHPPSKPLVALAKRTPQQVTEYTINGEIENDIDKRPIKRKKKRIKSSLIHSDPDNHTYAPDLLVHSQLRHKNSKDNP